MDIGEESTNCGVGFGVGVVVVMEVTQVGVGSRATAMAMVTEEIADNSGAVKRRKLGHEKMSSSSPSSTFVQTEILDCEVHDVVNPVLKAKRNDSGDADGSRGSGGVPASCCSSTGSIEKLKASDIEESVEIAGANARHNPYGIESKPETEFKEESGELESTATKRSSTLMNNSSRKVLPVEKMPPEAEVEEFFATAQKVINENFKNKYNFDIVNDIPLEGRFKWIEVKPGKRRS